MEEMITALDGVLRELRVRYVIIGGIAASVWGRPRMTVNADVVAVISKQRLPILLKVFKQYGFRILPASESKIVEKLKRLSASIYRCYLRR